MFLGCTASSNAGLRNHDLLSWISSFSSCRPPPLRIPLLKWHWRLVDGIPDMLHRWWNHDRCLSDCTLCFYGRLWNGDRWSIAVWRWLYSVISDLQPFWRIGLVAMLHRSYVRVCSLLTSCWPTIVSCQNSCQFSVKKCIPVDISVISLGFLPSGINCFLAVDFWRSSKLYPTFINVYRLDNLQRIATKLLSKRIENLWSFFIVGVRFNLPLYAPSSCGHGYSSRRTIYVELLWPTYVELLRLLIGNW